MGQRRLHRHHRVRATPTSPMRRVETAISPRRARPSTTTTRKSSPSAPTIPIRRNSKLTEDKITVTTDATAQQNQSSIDFLFASGATGSTYNPDVKFTDETKNGCPNNSFHHGMSRITFTFIGGSGVTIPAEGPLNYTLKELLLEGSFDTANGQAAATTTDRENVTLPGSLTPGARRRRASARTGTARAACSARTTSSPYR